MISDDDTSTMIGRLRKNKSEILYIALSEYMGHDLLSLRVFYETPDGEERPGKGGFGIRVAALPELIGILEEAQVEAAKRGLIPQAARP